MISSVYQAVDLPLKVEGGRVALGWLHVGLFLVALASLGWQLVQLEV